MTHLVGQVGELVLGLFGMARFVAHQEEGGHAALAFHLDLPATLEHVAVVVELSAGRKEASSAQ